MTRCSVVIRCLNEAPHLPALFDGLARQTAAPDETILVDSGSTDASVSVARARGAQIVHISQREFSFGRSLNTGIAATRGELIVIASAHIYPMSNRWLEHLLEPFTDPQVALVYGGQRGDQRSRFSEQQIFRQWFPAEPSNDQRHPFCNNANAAVRRSMWDALPYDETLSGLEDIHWAQRALERGFRIAYRPLAAVIHVHEETDRQIYRRYFREALALQTISPRERMGLLQALGLMGHAIRSDVREAHTAGRLWREIGSIVRFRAAQYWGAYRGSNYRGRMTSALHARLYYPSAYSTRLAQQAATTETREQT